GSDGWRTHGRQCGWFSSIVAPFSMNGSNAAMSRSAIWLRTCWCTKWVTTSGSATSRWTQSSKAPISAAVRGAPLAQRCDWLGRVDGGTHLPAYPELVRSDLTDTFAARPAHNDPKSECLRAAQKPSADRRAALP